VPTEVTRLSVSDVTKAIAKSVGNPKFTRTPDGQSLYLLTRNGRGYWSYQWREGSASRAKMLGTAGDMSPTKARQAREEAAVKRRNGKAPERRGAVNRKASAKPRAGGKLFSEVVTEYLEGVALNWTGGLEGLEAKAYRRTLTRHALASILVNDVTTGDVEEHLGNFKPATAEKTRLRVQTILDHAMFKEYRAKGDNPARLEGHLEHSAVRKVAPKAKHHPSMRSADVPAFMAQLVVLGTPTARALGFAILTAARRDEAREMRWKELVGNVWTCPAERMKGKMEDRIEHRVPLSPETIRFLGKRGAPDDFVFPGSDGPVKPIYENAMNVMLKAFLAACKISLTPDGKCPVPHGFRTTFKGDWALKAGYPHELREMALSHAVGDAVAQSYGLPAHELYTVRIPMMKEWAKFVFSKSR
jgi:integrase